MDTRNRCKNWKIKAQKQKVHAN